MTDSVNVGVLLKRYRLTAGLSQEALAVRAGVSARAVSDIERGVHRTPHSATLDLLATALALSPQRRLMLLAAVCPDVALAVLDEPSEGLVRPRNMPYPPAALIGRDRERALAAACAREGERRLLTLTGPGGVGKTRLALQIAEDLVDAFPDGLFFAGLAPISDASQIPNVLALALGLTGGAERPPAERIAAHLRDQRALILLDNVERVAAGGAPFIAELLARCPRLFILATSRSPLRVRAERTLPVAPMPAPDAMTLFRERARDLRPDSVYEPSQVAAICARLDYLPLAIELAAAQTGALPPPMLLERLSQRLHVLRDGPRDLPDRQRTMEATLDWSYDLLTGERQAVFRALSVFASGWTLDAAIALRSPDTSPTPEETILTLAALVDASLVQVDILPAAPIRWRLLDITREYALARLRATGEEEAYLRRAAEYLAHLGETALTLGPERRVDGARLDLELPNARLALEWAEQRREADIGLRLAGFARVWHACGQPREAVDWLDRMLALDAQARASGGLVAPPTTRVSRLYGLARAVLGCGDPQLAERRLHEAISLASSLQDHGGMAEAFATLGDIAQADSRLELAMAAYTESYAHARLAPDGYPMHRALAQLAELARLRGDMTQAEQRLEEALASARAGDSSWEIAIVTSQLGRIARVRNRYAKARAYYQESLSFFGAFEASAFTARSLEGLAATLTAEGRHAPSVRLYAGSAAIRQRCGSPAPAADRDAIEEALARARIALGEPLYRAEWSTGAALSSDALITEALAHASGERALAPSPRIKKRGR